MNFALLVDLLREVFGIRNADEERAIAWLLDERPNGRKEAREDIVTLAGDLRDALRARIPGARVRLRFSRDAGMTVEILDAGGAVLVSETGTNAIECAASAALRAWRTCDER